MTQYKNRHYKISAAHLTMNR